MRKKKKINLIINTNPRSDVRSVNVALARRLSKRLGGTTKIIRLYESDQKYFSYRFKEDWMKAFIDAGCVIFPVPMWNLSIPAALKDFFDKIIKKGHVWDLDKKNRFVGLLADRPVYIIMTSGDFYHPGHPHDFVVPYMRAVLKSIGIKSVHDFRIGGVKGDATLLKDKKFMAAKTKAMFKAFGY